MGSEWWEARFGIWEGGMVAWIMRVGGAPCTSLENAWRACCPGRRGEAHACGPLHSARMRQEMRWVQPLLSLSPSWSSQLGMNGDVQGLAHGPAVGEPASLVAEGP